MQLSVKALAFLLINLVFIVPSTTLADQKSFDVSALKHAYLISIPEQLKAFSEQATQANHDGRFRIAKDDDIIVGTYQPPRVNPKFVNSWAGLSQLTVMLYLRPGSAQTREWQTYFSDGIGQYIAAKELSLIVRFFATNENEAIFAVMASCAWHTGAVKNLTELLSMASQPANSDGLDSLIKRFALNDASMNVCVNANKINRVVDHTIALAPYCFYLRCNSETLEIGKTPDPKSASNVRLPVMGLGYRTTIDSNDPPQTFFQLQDISSTLKKVEREHITRSIAALVKEIQRPIECSDWKVKPPQC